MLPSAILKIISHVFRMTDQIVREETQQIVHLILLKAIYVLPKMDLYVLILIQAGIWHIIKQI
jgi:hypothetical protein